MWEEVKLEDVCDLITCGVAKRPNYVDSGVPFLSAKNIKNQSVVWDNYKFVSPADHAILTRKNKPKMGDVLYTRVGSFGEAAVVDKDIEFSIFVSLTLIKTKDILLNKFLVYYLNSPMGKNLAKKNVNSSGVGNLNVAAVRKFLIPLPPLEEQKQIVAKLDNIFSEIDFLICNINRNKFNLSVFFNKQRNKIYRELFKNEKSFKLKEVVNLSRGHNPPKSQFINIPKEGYVRFYQIRDAKSDKFATYVPESKKLRKVVRDDLLMNAYRHIGEVFTGVEGAFNVALCKLSIKDFNILDKDFLYFMIPSFLIKERLLAMSERSLIPSMSVKELAEINVPVPDIPKQIEVSSRIKKIEELIHTQIKINDQKLANLISLKFSILSRDIKV